jgi:tetratricopeptide (TPR) repeat protein
MVKLIVFLIFLAGCIPAVEQPTISSEQRIEREHRLQLLVTEGTTEMRQGSSASFQRALAAFSLARDLSPLDPRVNDALGSLSWRMGNKFDARRSFKLAIESDPSYDAAYGHLALLAEEEGKINAAKELYELALSKNPLNFQTRTNYSRLLQRYFSSKSLPDNELYKAYYSDGKNEPVIRSNLLESLE